MSDDVYKNELKEIKKEIDDLYQEIGSANVRLFLLMRKLENILKHTEED